jgi:hypothetical protein
MTREDQELQDLRAAFTAPADAAPETETCPPPERIWAAVRGELPPAELREVVDHTAFCAACAEDWRLAAELAREEEARPAAAPAPSNVVYGRFRRFGNVAAAALAAMLLLVVGLRVTGVIGTDEPIYRAGERPAIESRVPEAAALPAERFVLGWTPVPEAAGYDVRVSTEGLRVIHEARGVGGTELQVPASALEGLPPGTRLLWQVEAALPEGAREVSKTFVTRLE